MTSSAKRRFRIILFTGAFIIAALTLIHWLGSGADLRRYKEQLRARGDKFTLAEVSLPVSTNVEHIASRKVFYTNAFQLPTNKLSAMQYVSPGRARTAWGADAPIVNWTPIEQEIARSASSLESFRQALKNPAPDGWDCNSTLTNPVSPKMSYVAYRSLSSGFLNDEIIALHRGDLPAALADVHALAGLARLNRNELTLVQSGLATFVVELGLKGTWEILQAPGLNDQQLASLQADWEQINLFDTVEHGFVGERAQNQSLMARVRKMDGRQFDDAVSPWLRYGNTGGFVAQSNAPMNSVWQVARSIGHRLWYENIQPFGYRIFSVNEDELVQLRYYTGTVDAIRLLKSNHSWPEAHDALEKAVKEVDDRFKRDPLKRLMFSHITIGNSTRSVEMIVQRETQRRLTVTAIAIKRYQTKNGKPPVDLASMIPEFLVAVPIDPMSGKPLRYRLNADSTFVLYSVGMDGKDDGGTSGLGLWTDDSPDAVWPTVGIGEVRQTLNKSSVSR